jgi:hypothetical protein
VPLQNIQRGRGKHAVPEGPKPEDRNPAAPRQTF